MSARKKIRIGLCCPVRRAGSLAWSPVSRSPACCRSFAARRSAPPNSSSATRRSSCASRTRSHLIMKPKSNRASPQGLKPNTLIVPDGTAEEAAEKRHLPCVLKGRTFRCAVQVLSSCHSEWASAHEESAFRTFSAASEAVPLQSALGSTGPTAILVWNMSRSLLLMLGLVLLVFCSIDLAAQDNYEIQVYPSETIPPKTTMVELHSNFLFQGSKATEEGVLPTEHELHETIEITQGFTPWFETGFYIFTTVPNGQGWRWVGDHIRPRVRAPESWHWPVGVSLSAEGGYARPIFSTSVWSLEIRPIVDKQKGRPYWSINPAFEKAFTGPENAGLIAQYSRPFCLSTIGLISRLQTEVEKIGRAYPNSEDKLTPTGQCQLSGARTRGRMWSPTHRQP